MSSKLNTEGKLALMEQSLQLQRSNTFRKILLTRKCFTTLSSLRSVYRLRVSFDLFGARVWFESHSTRWFEGEITTTSENARRLFCFLNPRILVVGIYKSFQEEAKFVGFLQNSNCQIAMHYYPENTVPHAFVERFWPRVIEMEIDGEKIHELGGLPAKHFDKLLVYGITSLDELRQTFRHDARELTIHINESDFFEQTDFRRIRTPIGIKRLNICFNLGVFTESTLSSLKTLINVLKPTLSRVEIETCFSSMQYNYDTCEKLIQDIEHGVKWVMRIAEVLTEINIYSTVKHYFEEYGSHGFQTNWIDKLKKAPSLKDIQLEIKEQKVPVESHIGNVAPFLADLILERKLGKVEIKCDGFISLFY